VQTKERDVFVRTDTGEHLDADWLAEAMLRLVPVAPPANTALEPVGEQAAVMHLTNLGAHAWLNLENGLDELVDSVLEDCFHER